MRSKTIGSATAGNNTGGATADYTSIASWEASIADTDDETGTIITMVAPTDTAAVTVNAAASGGRTYLLTADTTVEVKAPTTAEASAKARATSASGFVLTITVGAGANWVLERFAMVVSSTGSFVTAGNSSGSLTVRRMVFVTTGSARGFSYGQLIVTVDNCAVIGSFHATEITRCVAATTYTFYHCSFLMTGTTPTCGIRGGNGSTVTCYACIVQGAGGTLGNYESGVVTAGDENVSQDNTAPGTTNWRSKTGVFTNATAGSEDLSLSASHDAGTYTVTDRSGTIADLATDLVGTSRASPIDAGVWQTPAAGSTFTATCGSTAGGAAAAATATFKPKFSASAAAAAGGAASAVSATFDPPVFSASAAAAAGGAAAAASAEFSPPVFSASVASTSGGAAAAASATFDPPVFTASCASTAGGAAAAATALFAAQIVTASCASSAGGAAIAATATFDPPVFSATATVTAGGAGVGATASTGATMGPMSRVRARGGTRASARAGGVRAGRRR